MNLESHVFVSKLVYEEITKIFPIHINKKFFRAGNILTDYSPLVWTHPHYYTVSWEYISKYIDMVSSLKSDEDAMEADNVLSFQLGIICHYITDFFCRAHIGSGIGPKREHLQYEDFLDNYRNSISNRLKHTDWLDNFEPYTTIEETKEELRNCIEEYRKMPASPERDITCAISNSIKVMVSIISIRLKQAVTKDIFRIHKYLVMNYQLSKFSKEELFKLVTTKNYSKVLAAIRQDEE